MFCFSNSNMNCNEKLIGFHTCEIKNTNSTLISDARKTFTYNFQTFWRMKTSTVYSKHETTPQLDPKAISSHEKDRSSIKAISHGKASFVTLSPRPALTPKQIRKKDTCCVLNEALVFAPRNAQRLHYKNMKIFSKISTGQTRHKSTMLFDFQFRNMKICIYRKSRRFRRHTKREILPRERLCTTKASQTFFSVSFFGAKSEGLTAKKLPYKGMCGRLGGRRT